MWAQSKIRSQVIIRRVTRRRGSNTVHTWAPGAGPWVGFAKDLRQKTSFPPAVDRASSTREKTKINLPPPWVEHGIFRLQGERINHYATEAGGNQHFLDVRPIHIPGIRRNRGSRGEVRLSARRAAGATVE